MRSKSVRKNAANDLKREQRKQLLKVGIAALFAIVLCSWAAYRWFNPGTERYNDFVVDSAIDWLENADWGYFDDCRKDIIDKNGWFDWFVKDQKSLGKIKSRKLIHRRYISGGTRGMKRYELKFNSKFSQFSPQCKTIEQMIIETDGKKQFKVLIADYWMGNGVKPIFFKPSENTRKQIMAVAEKVFKKAKSGNIEFFKYAYSEIDKKTDYFNWKPYLVSVLNPERAERLYKVLNKGNHSPLKLDDLKTYVPVGRTGFEASWSEYLFSVENQGKKVNYILIVIINRDLYQNKSAEWKFGGWRFHRQSVKSEGKITLKQKMENIIIPQIFIGGSVEFVTQYLCRDSKQFDPDGVGVKIILKSNAANKKVRLKLEDKSLYEVIDSLCTAEKLKFRIEEDTVVISD
ncbi:MAG: DUF4974 domain-containing protein [Victivallaceae bacterium]|nr:DUF4974 domain-containing protein [Victivallaceae bacterium]